MTILQTLLVFVGGPALIYVVMALFVHPLSAALVALYMPLWAMLPASPRRTLSV